MKKRTGHNCIECGKRLILFHEDVVVETGPTDGSEPLTPTHMKFPRGYGIHGNGLFCSHRCGFQFAVRWVRRLMWWWR